MYFGDSSKYNEHIDFSYWLLQDEQLKISGYLCQTASNYNLILTYAHISTNGFSNK